MSLQDLGKFSSWDFKCINKGETMNNTSNQGYIENNVTNKYDRELKSLSIVMLMTLNIK